MRQNPASIGLWPRKTATGPTSVKIAPLKSKTGDVITDQSMQLQRWVEHYLELNSTHGKQNNLQPLHELLCLAGAAGRDER